MLCPLFGRPLSHGERAGVRDGTAVIYAPIPPSQGSQ